MSSCVAQRKMERAFRNSGARTVLKRITFSIMRTKEQKSRNAGTALVECDGSGEIAKSPARTRDLLLARPLHLLTIHATREMSQADDRRSNISKLMHEVSWTANRVHDVPMHAALDVGACHGQGPACPAVDSCRRCRNND